MKKAMENKGLEKGCRADTADRRNFSRINLCAVQPDLPGLPEPSRTCLECGSDVPAEPARGRPLRFCCEACRKAHAVAQRRAWRNSDAADADRTELTCRTCGQAFTVERSVAGRVPHFCSHECRRAGIRGREATYRARRRRGPKQPQ